MIYLTIIDGKAFVWNADDWLKLRKDHRIVGQLIGSIARFPQQENFLGLPMVLLPEETTLLVENKIACTVNYPVLTEKPTDEVQKLYQLYKKEVTKGQIEIAKEERKKQIIEKTDRIVEGKRRKLMGLPTKQKIRKKDESADVSKQAKEDAESEDDKLEREKLLQAEFSKIQPLDANNVMVQTFTECPWVNEDDAEEIRWQLPTTYEKKLRYKAFKSLWEQGYYLTSGHKFGVDFLVYPGDPVKFHAYFLLKCLDEDSRFPASYLIRLGRLGNSVRKTVVLAELDDEGEVSFLSLTWSGKK